MAKPPTTLRDLKIIESIVREWQKIEVSTPPGLQRTQSELIMNATMFLAAYQTTETGYREMTEDGTELW